MLMRFKDGPRQPDGRCMVPPGSENKAMHVSLHIGETTILASDGRGLGIRCRWT